MNQANAGQKSAPAQVMIAITNSQMRSFLLSGVGLMSSGVGLMSSGVVAACGAVATTSSLTLPAVLAGFLNGKNELSKREVGETMPRARSSSQNHHKPIVAPSGTPIGRVSSAIPKSITAQIKRRLVSSMKPKVSSAKVKDSA